MCVVNRFSVGMNNRGNSCHICPFSGSVRTCMCMTLTVFSQLSLPVRSWNGFPVLHNRKPLCVIVEILLVLCNRKSLCVTLENAYFLCYITGICVSAPLVN